MIPANLFNHDETRTRNLLIRSQTPYPLGHAASHSCHMLARLNVSGVHTLWGMVRWFLCLAGWRPGFHLLLHWRLEKSNPDIYSLKCQPPVRIELTTPGLQDQCSSHWAMEAYEICFWQAVSIVFKINYLPVHSCSPCIQKKTFFKFKFGAFLVGQTNNDWCSSNHSHQLRWPSG